MNADVAFETGSSHRICEDYARANNENPQQPFVLISDGCSDPRSPDTDFGARLLIKNAENSIKAGIWENINGVLALAESQAKGINLHPNCLDATLLYIIRTVDIHAVAHGDGAIAARDKDGVITLTLISFPGGFPYYPNYIRDKSRLESFNAVGKRIITKYELKPDGTEVQICEKEESGPVTSEIFSSKDFDVVAIFSDGIGSFQKIENGHVISMPSQFVARGIMSFKGTKGEFVQRRFNGFISECQKNGVKHYDDFSVGAIYLGE
jgi:hypothetical protein